MLVKNYHGFVKNWEQGHIVRQTRNVPYDVDEESSIGDLHAKSTLQSNSSSN